MMLLRGGRLLAEGADQLVHPRVRRHAGLHRSGSYLKPVVEPQTEPIRVWHLLTHTSGLTYGFHNTHPVDAIYRHAGFEWGIPAGIDLAACCAAWAQLPLCSSRAANGTTACRPMCSAASSKSSSGLPLDEFMKQRIFDPLGMTETDFWVPARRATGSPAVHAAPGDGRERS